MRKICTYLKNYFYTKSRVTTTGHPNTKCIIFMQYCKDTGVKQSIKQIEYLNTH